MAHLIPKLRCQFAEFLNQSYLKRLRILSQSTCVGLRYDYNINSLRGFSWQHGVSRFTRLSPLLFASRTLRYPDFPKYHSTCLNLLFRQQDDLSFCVPPSLVTLILQYGNINPFPIIYAFRPQLRDRLTLRGLTLLRKPQTYGEYVFHIFSRYLCQHTLFRFLQQFFRSTFSGCRNAPLPHVFTYIVAASVSCLAPVHFRRGLT